MTDARTFARPLSGAESDALRRTMQISIAVHVIAVVVLFVIPREWLRTSTVQPPTMTISLGAAGPKTAGMNTAGQRPVEAVAPPPKRSEPERTATPTNTPTVASVKAPKPPPKATPTEPAPIPVPPRPPITGKQVTQGTSRAETGATGQGTGLAGGGGAGATADVLSPDFCCPDYVKEMQRRITDKWKQAQQESGTVVLSFVIHRDGKFSDLKTEKSASSLLEYHARNAFNGLILPPLPGEYKDEKLTVRLTFNYGR